MFRGAYSNEVSTPRAFTPPAVAFSVVPLLTRSPLRAADPNASLVHIRQPPAPTRTKSLSPEQQAWRIAPLKRVVVRALLHAVCRVQDRGQLHAQIRSRVVKNLLVAQ